MSLVVAIAFTVYLSAAGPLLFARGGSAPVDLGPLPAGLASTDASACAGCHAEIAAEWRGSGHASSWTNKVFQDAYAVEPLAPCRNCHAPNNDGGLPAQLAASDGVSCNVCHVRGGHVLGVHGVTVAAHAGRVEPQLREATFCASCHQFGFFSEVDGQQVELAEPQQDTWGEWTRSSASRQGISCVDCHMPRSGQGAASHRSHAFLGGRDLTMLRSAVTATVTARREGQDVIVDARVVAAATGHSFPTGDLFRRAEMTIRAGDAVKTLSYARRFRDHVAVRQDGQIIRERREVADTRVPPPGAGIAPTRQVRFVGSTVAEVTWSFDYLIMPTIDAAAGGTPVERLGLFQGTATVATTRPDQPTAGEE